MNKVTNIIFKLGGVGLLFLSLNVEAAKKDAAKKPKITIAVDDWCPYVCTGISDKGYMIDMALEILKPKYDVELKEVGWARSLKQIKAGKITFMMGGSVRDFEGMKTNKVPVGYSGGCFYARKGEENWKYTGSKSLEKRVLGWIQDYDWNDDLDAYVAKHKDNSKKIFMIGGDDPYARRKELLKKKRIDVFGEDENVWNYLTEQDKDAALYGMVGCEAYVPKDDHLFAGFNASKKNAKLVDAVIADLDKGLKKMIASGRDGEIMKKYGLPSLSGREKQLKKRTKIGEKI